MNLKARSITLHKRKFYQVSFEQNVAVASLNIYDAYNQKSVVHNADFMLAVERAIAEDDTKITFGNRSTPSVMMKGRSRFSIVPASLLEVEHYR